MHTGGPWRHSRPDLRASDAERERVAAFLRDQAAEGRLTPEELEERVWLAYRAVTVRELRALTADLPGSPLARPRPLARRPASRRMRALLPFGFVALLAVSGPTVAWVMLWVAAAMGLVLTVTLLALGIAFSPFILVAILIVIALRRRGGPLSYR